VICFDKGLCSNLHGASITLQTILLGVSGAIYNNHTLEPFNKLGLGSQRKEKTPLVVMTQPAWLRVWSSNSSETCFQASCSFCQRRCQTCPYQTCPFQYCYRLSSGVRRFQVKSVTLLIPIDPFGGGVLRYPVPKWLLSLQWCGEFVFTCLRRLFLNQKSMMNVRYFSA